MRVGPGLSELMTCPHGGCVVQLILALDKFAFLIINALKPARSMERNRLTRTCQKTGAGPQGGLPQLRRGLPGDISGAQGPITRYKPWWSCLKRGREISLLDSLQCQTSQ